MGQIALVRAPFTYRYNRTDVREEVILTQLACHLDAIGEPHRIFDFHLFRDLTAGEITAAAPTAIVIAVRETGDNVHYALRLAGYLKTQTDVPVVLYGQTARLAEHPLLAEGVLVVRHDERALARVLGLAQTGPAFDDLTISPYCNVSDLQPWQARRFRATIETSRGCPYPCKFCFINAGENHERRWQVQSLAATVGSIQRYVEAGSRAFVFHDSEFLGGARRDIEARSQLVQALRQDVPPIAFKVYARADTILKYPDLAGLRDAGLVSVFMGVESLVQSDLDALGKAMRLEAIHEAITVLAEHEVYMDLSFILFNRATTRETLRANLERVLRLYSSPHARLLGMPHFTFSFESAWQDASSQPLSQVTYVDWDVRMKSPRRGGAVFDPALEPLMEIYRLLAYEWSRKVVDLNLARDTASPAEFEAIERWLGGLGAFCARTMLAFLDDHDRGRLTLAHLPAARDRLFEAIETYNHALPAQLSGLATHAGHASRLSYDGASRLVEDDEYWLRQIPDVAATVDATGRQP